MGDKPDFCNVRFVNPDFSRISKNKTILKSRTSSVTLADLERIESGSRTILVGDSHCFWLLSSLLALLKDDGYRPSDPALFDKNISSLSAALASQTMMASGVTDFVSSKRRESCLAHAACTIAESVKRDLLVAPGTESFLFDQPLLEKVVSQMKEDSLISSTASLASLSKAASRRCSWSSGSERYSSPLDQRQSSSFGSRKRSASPVCSSFAKCGRWGRGMTPSSAGARVFASRSHVPGSQPSCSRRLSVAPLAGVEQQGRGALGSGGLAVGIPYSLSSDTHLIQGTHPFSGVQSRFHQGQGLGGGGLFSVGEESNRAHSPPIYRVLQPVICGDESLRVVEAGNRPLATELEDSEDIL